jgi:hypothetical protein
LTLFSAEVNARYSAGLASIRDATEDQKRLRWSRAFMPRIAPKETRGRVGRGT